LISRDRAKLNGILRVYSEINVAKEYDFYEGEFLGGMMHGFGRLISSNGDLYIGEFENGQF